MLLRGGERDCQGGKKVKIIVPRKEEQTTTNLSTQNRPPAEKNIGEGGGDWEGWRSGEERREQQFLSARNAEEQYKLHFEFGGCPLCVVFQKASPGTHQTSVGWLRF